MKPIMLAAALAVATAALYRSAAADPIELQWWHAMTAVNAERVNKIAADFNASQSAYKVVPVYKGSYAETMTTAVAAFRAGQAPDIRRCSRSAPRQSALLVRPMIAVEQLRVAAPPAHPVPEPMLPNDGTIKGPIPPTSRSETTDRKPRRFFGSVEIDTVRPVKAFDAIVSAVVMELQRSKGAKVKLTLEIEADAEGGFSDADIGVVRDNTRQLKFKAEVHRLRIMGLSMPSACTRRPLHGRCYRRDGMGMSSAGRGSRRASIFEPKRSAAARSGSSARWA